METNDLNKKNILIVNHEYTFNKDKLKKFNDTFEIKNSKFLIHSIKKQKSKSKKYIHKFNFQYYFFINFLLLICVIFFLPKKISSSYKVTLKLKEIGEQQIFSEGYNIIDYNPAIIKVNNRIEQLNNKKIEIRSMNDKIIIEWETPHSNLSYMFANLTNISTVSINYTFDSKEMNISHMFYNCKNLKTISFIGANSQNFKSINLDATKMFYNCSALTSFKCKNIMHSINYINMSYIFYNCIILHGLTFSGKIIINDMRYMFYNCRNLTSIDFSILYSIINVYIL